MATFGLIVISIWAIYGLAVWRFLPMSGVFPAGFFSVMIWTTGVAAAVWFAAYLLAWWFRGTPNYCRRARSDDRTR